MSFRVFSHEAHLFPTMHGHDCSPLPWSPLVSYYIINVFLCMLVYDMHGPIWSVAICNELVGLKNAHDKESNCATFRASLCCGLEHVCAAFSRHRWLNKHHQIYWVLRSTVPGSGLRPLQSCLQLISVMVIKSRKPLLSHRLFLKCQKSFTVSESVIF